MFFGLSCNLQKHIPDDELLLRSVDVENIPSGHRSDVKQLIRQKPNKRILGLFRIGMWIHIRADRGKERRFKTWIKENMGEAPVLLDTNAMNQSAVNIRNYLFSHGYFNSEVSIETKVKNKRANVTFSAEPGNPYIIDSVAYHIMDRSIHRLVEAEERHTYLKPGEVFKSDNLTNERNRISTVLRDRGYYRFSREFVYFDIDSTIGENKVHIGIGIRNRPGNERHELFNINRIYIETDYRLIDTLPKDTFKFEGFYFISNDSPIKPEAIIPFIFFEPGGSRYQLSNHQLTIARLSGLRFYRFIDIEFNVLEDTLSASGNRMMDCYIRLSPSKKQEIVFDSEAMTREENDEARDLSSERFYGIAGNLIYRHKNLIRRGLEYEARIGGLFEVGADVLSDDAEWFSNYQIRGGSSIYFPRLYVPWNIDRNIKDKASRTAFNLNYLFEQNRDFERTSGNLSLVYQIDGNLNRHLITPLEISLVNTEVINPDFRQRLDELQDPFLRNLYDSRHIITSSRYTLVYDDRLRDPLPRQWFIRFNVIELAGNTLWFANRLLDREPEGSFPEPAYSIFGVNFYQYIRSDLDIRYYINLPSDNQLVSRFYTGAGYAYGNTASMPLERRFFIGGTNSLRAWRVREIGPGSYSPDVDVFSDRTGSFKLESNLEYRFDMFYLFEGALFVDAGNIWALRESYREEERLGAEFSFDRFYKEIAVGTGFGLRLDFTFFILRLDTGLPVHDPAKAQGERWVIEDLFENRWFRNNANFNLGIGYPF